MGGCEGAGCEGAGGWVDVGVEVDVMVWVDEGVRM